MTRGAALVALSSLVVLGAVLHALGTTAPPRERDATLAPLPSAQNPAPAGLGAAAAWLEATGRPMVRLERPDDRPPRGAVRVLAAPRAPLGEPEVAALLEEVAAGGLLVWATGEPSQPALARALGVQREAGHGDRAVAGGPGHPLLAGLALQASAASVTCERPEALVAAGPEDRPAALSLPLGRGEVLVLSGPELLDDAHIAELDHLSFWVRLASRGPIAFDERWLLPRTARRRPAATPLALAAQAALWAGLLLAAVGRRHGAVRPPPPPGTRRTARDYLASLGALYARAGAGEALAVDAWRRLRGRLERTAAVPARLPADECARRLEARRPEAAEALRRGEAALALRGPGRLLAVLQAAADVEAGLRHPAPLARTGLGSPGRPR